MKLDEIQTALFAAYDIQNTLTPQALGKRIYDASFGETVGSNLNEIIEVLEEIEKELGGEQDNTPGNEDRPSPAFASARECAIDEQAQMMDDPWEDER